MSAEATGEAACGPWSGRQNCGAAIGRYHTLWCRHRPVHHRPHDNDSYHAHFKIRPPNLVNGNWLLGIGLGWHPRWGEALAGSLAGSSARPLPSSLADPTARTLPGSLAESLAGALLRSLAVSFLGSLAGTLARSFPDSSAQPRADSLSSSSASSPASSLAGTRAMPPPGFLATALQRFGVGLTCVGGRLFCCRNGNARARRRQTSG